jgi:hypothetical protein
MILYRSYAPALIVIHKCLKTRHSGRESVARVGRNPGYMDVFEIAIHGTEYLHPSGYDGLLEVCV